MTKQEIISSYEDFDRVLSDFARDIDRFKNDMSLKSDNVMHTVFDLGNKWKKNGYDDFRKNMGNKMNNINNSLEKCDQLSAVLKKLSTELQSELEKLRNS